MSSCLCWALSQPLVAEIWSVCEKHSGGEHGHIYWGESDMMDKIQMRLNSGMMDSGLVVVVFIISSLIIITFSFLLLVDYEWCHVLYKNNTVSSIRISSKGKCTIRNQGPCSHPISPNNLKSINLIRRICSLSVQIYHR